MIATDEAALRCDFLETYHVFDYRALPARQAALFACGLNESSRIKRRLSGLPAPFDTILLAIIADAVKTLVWQRTEDGVKGINKPDSIAKAILDRDAERDQQGFASVEEYNAWRNSMLEGADE